ncbi:ArsR/SmtB family transcription factor [Pseudodesulfovibrio pelocollis]|uniref:ArsR/SmtB family transcription factor n=1 Tax=Pseudodesulfovibrio pelocollis TaxID=3051432 RepID=UPI00255A7EEC|nr:metalloregulator ArsR/SmtB family transcription factor [Pseudodesulfovibrio sp. SB368]
MKQNTPFPLQAADPTGSDRLDSDALAEGLKALGHPARIRILAHLLQEDRCLCGGIVEVMPLAQSTVSQHLKVLKQAGLVRGEVEGPRTCYCADRNALKRLAEAMRAMLDQPGTGGDE